MAKLEANITAEFATKLSTDLYTNRSTIYSTLSIPYLTTFCSTN